MTMTTTQLLIGDRDVDAAGAATFTRQNPVSGEVARRAANASVADALAAAEAAAEAFRAWSWLGPPERAQKLPKGADLFERRVGGLLCAGLEGRGRPRRKRPPGRLPNVQQHRRRWRWRHAWQLRPILDSAV